MQRRKLRFFGRVQGVGFRFTSGLIADKLKLTGWVKNNSDGSVSMEIQGDFYNIYKFLKELTADSYIKIDHVENHLINVDPSEKKFRTIY